MPFTYDYSILLYYFFEQLKSHEGNTFTHFDSFMGCCCILSHSVVSVKDWILKAKAVMLLVLIRDTFASSLNQV